MKVVTSINNGELTVAMSGELDHHGAKGAIGKLEAVIQEYMPRACLIDMSELSFMDSSGIAVLLRIHKRMRELGGQAAIRGLGAQPAKVVAAAGIGRIVPIIEPGAAQSTGGGGVSNGAGEINAAERSVK